MKDNAEPQEPQNRELVVDMVRNHDRAPSSWCDGGPLYPVWRAGELPASCWYTTKAGANREYKAHLPTGGVLSTRPGKPVALRSATTVPVFSRIRVRGYTGSQT